MRFHKLLRYMVAVGLGALASGAHAGHADDGPATVPVVIHVDWRHPGPRFEGWGTALAWFAHVTGKFAEPQRTRLADLLYGRDGLALNIARYNIGGGNAPGTPAYLRPGGDIPGFWRKPDGWNPDADDAWDWSADAGQRWWLDAIKARVTPRDLILEAFSNSPPYFMTRSGLVSGNVDGLEDNLRPGFETQFAHYLARVTAELERRHGIRFRTLSPVNEPNTPYWFSTNKQEGAHWSPEAQSRMFIALAKVLAEYVKAFGPTFVGLTGSPDQIKAVEKEYHVYAAQRPVDPGNPKRGYSMDHSSVLYLMGPDGKLISFYDEAILPDELAKDLRGKI